MAWLPFVDVPVTFSETGAFDRTLVGITKGPTYIKISLANLLKREGRDHLKAVREAASVRLRPIFLTTVTTVSGLLPTAYGIGGLDPFVVPIALSLGWGLAFGALLTSLVLPALLAISDDVIGFLFGLFRSKRTKDEHQDEPV